MNIGIDIYKNSLHLSNQQAISIIKRARYMLSGLQTQKEDIIGFNFGGIFTKEEKVLLELKKLINMTLYMIQTKKLDGIVLYIDELIDKEEFRNIIDLAKFSGITNRLKIKTKSIKDKDFLMYYPELKVEIIEKDDTIFSKRYVLDQKEEFICKLYENGEK